MKLVPHVLLAVLIGSHGDILFPVLLVWTSGSSLILMRENVDPPELWLSQYDQSNLVILEP